MKRLYELPGVNNFSAGGCYFSFLIDDQLVSRIDREEMTIFHLPKGNHKYQVEFHTKWDGASYDVGHALSHQVGQLFTASALFTIN